MESRVFYKESVFKELKRIDPPVRKELMDKITVNLSKVPPEGKMLTGPLKGLWSYRIGDYRAIYTRLDEGVLVVRIMHRREVYK